MAFNGSGTASGGSATAGGGGSGSGGDGPLNKRLCTGKENNEAGLNNNRVSIIILSKRKLDLLPRFGVRATDGGYHW